VVCVCGVCIYGVCVWYVCGVWFGKTIVLTIRTFVGKVMSLLFNNFNFKIINVLY